MHAKMRGYAGAISNVNVTRHWRNDTMRSSNQPFSTCATSPSMIDTIGGGRRGRMADGAESVSTVQERKRHHRQTCGCTRADAYIGAYKSLMGRRNDIETELESVCLLEICAVKWCFHRKTTWRAILDGLIGKKSGVARLDPRAVLKSEGSVIAFSSESNSFFLFFNSFFNRWALLLVQCAARRQPSAGRSRRFLYRPGALSERNYKIDSGA